MALISMYRKRTIHRDLIIGLTAAVILTVTVHIVIYYLYSTNVSRRELNAKADSISEEFSDVLAISLWNLSRNVIHQISQAYLKSANLEGILVLDDQGQRMFEKTPSSKRHFLIREKEIRWQGAHVGSVKLWFTGENTERVRKDMIRAMLLIGFSVTVIVIAGTHVIMRYLLNKPMAQLIQGIRTIASGDYESSMPSVPQDEVNSIIKEANMMAGQISIRNEQLKREIVERTRAEDELKRVNKTLEMRIGQLIEAEKALSESEKKYRGIFENALEGIFQTSPEGRFIDANPSMASILGYNSPDELIRSVIDIDNQLYVDPRQREEYLQLLEQQDLVSNYECPFYRKDGTIIWGIIQVRAFRDETGRISRIEGVLQDITERKKAEMELRESEKKYRRLYEGSRDGYVMTDVHSDFVECNSSFCEMLGYSLEELHRLTYSEITPKKWRDLEKGLFKKQTIERGYTDVYEKEYTRKDGSLIPVEMRAYLIQDRDGVQTGFWAFVRDITERNKLQSEAMRNARLASLGELAAGVAHEINNPINGIINYAQILVNRSRKQGRDADIPERIIKEGVRIERIVRGLLSFAREGSEKKYPVSMKTILSETLDFTSSMLRKDNIRVDIDMPGNLPEVMANAQQIQQVFLNIISNARYALNQRYAASNGKKRITIRSEIVGRGGGRKMRISFHDNGTGIAVNHIDRICDPFFSTKPSPKGTGLGLSISDGIIRDHDGRLWVESEEGSFTKIHIELPI